MEKQGLMLAPILSDGMILQREVSNNIYGREDIAATVIVSFMGADYYAEVDEKHEFCVELPPVSAGGPYEITVRGSTEITLQDVLVGDVYLLSGQSNMELPIRRVLDVSGEEIAQVQEPFIRQYHIPASYNFKEPESYIYAGSWKKAEGEDLLNFSAAGYFFAKELKEAYQIPVGLIMTAVGGSTIEAWMSPSSLAGFGNYQELIKGYDNLACFNEDIRKQQEESEEWLARLEQEEPKEQIIKDYTAWNTCQVPSFVSEFLGEDFQGSVYLCKEIHLEEEPMLDTAYIYMGSIIDSDRIWINHIEMGRTEYRYPPRKYQVPKGILKKGKNLITVRIVINNTNGGTVKGKPYLLHYDNKEISLEGEWHYRIGKRSENPIPKVMFPPKLPVCFYNTAVVPLSRISVAGVLWYQGESNTDAPGNYADKFTAMVSDWRELFGWELPFIYVQLTNYKDPLTLEEDTGWAELRDQQ
ncbi:MAG: sialate O-acetylesterase, partial [Mobilitalea sp.]